MTTSTTTLPPHGRRPSSLGDFFRYHGFWSPGVRLFRGIGFTHKALVIALTFLLPLAVLSWNYFNSQADQIAFSAKERLGVTYAKAVMPLLAQVQARRLTPASAPDDSAALRQQLADLAEVERSHGEALGTAQVYRDARAAVDPLLASPQARDEAARKAQNQAQTAAMTALINLLTTATDGSNLTLDPDIDSYYLMDAAMFRLPGMIDAAGQIGTEGATVLTTAQASPAQVRGLIEQATLLMSNAAAVEVGIAKSQAYNAEVATAVKPEAALTALRELSTQLDATALRQQGVQGDAAAHTARIQRATEGMLRLATDASAELDRLIVRRVQRLEASRDVTAVVLVLGLCTALYLFMTFGKVLHGGLREVAFHIDAMRDGNLTTEPRPWGRDEAAHLMQALVQMQQSLRGIVSRVRSASENIVQAGNEISAGADDLSARTEQSAANLEQTASAMEQVAATVKNNEDALASAASLAASNAGTAERGGQIVGEAVRTMQGINDSSARIGDIIGTIEGIAFQTNILALNAAVEAARAGEQGRGFAVVASEVRSLAQRSAEAAKEIKTLITASVERVQGGVDVVQRAGDTMGELLSASRRMHELLADVAVGAREQSTGIAQTAVAVQQLDTATQQNAALVEQTAAAARSLKDQADGLAGEVAQFRLASA